MKTFSLRFYFILPAVFQFLFVSAQINEIVKPKWHIGLLSQIEVSVSKKKVLKYEVIAADYDHTDLYAIGQDEGELAYHVFVNRNNEWKELGQPFPADKDNYHASLLVDNGTVYVAFADKENGNKATVMKYDNQQWQAVGKRGFSEPNASHFDLAMDGGQLYLAFMDRFLASVAKFNGSEWVKLESAGMTKELVYDYRLTFHNHLPYLLFRGYKDKSTDYVYSIMYFDGGQWKYAGDRTLPVSNSIEIPIYHFFIKDAFTIAYIDKESQYSNKKYFFLATFESGKWTKLKLQEQPYNFASFFSIHTENARPVIQYKWINNLATGAPKDSLDITAFTNLLEENQIKRNTGDTIPLITTVLDANNLVKAKTSGAYKTKGYCLVPVKEAKQFSFVAAASQTAKYPEYEKVHIVNDTTLVVYNQGKYGLYTISGFKLPLEYDYISGEVYCGSTYLFEKAKKFGLFNLSNLRSETGYTSLACFKKDDLWFLKPVYFTGVKNGKRFAVDPTYPKIVGPDFDNLVTITDSTAIVTKDSMTALIHLKTGNALQGIQKMLSLRDGYTRIWQNNDQFTINKQLDIVPNLTELGEDYFYLIVMPKKNIPVKTSYHVKLEWDPYSYRQKGFGTGYPGNMVIAGSRLFPIDEFYKFSANTIYSLLDYTRKNSYGWPTSDIGIIVQAVPYGKYAFKYSVDEENGKQTHYTGTFTQTKPSKIFFLTLDF